jgi:hypothetical protein
VPLGGWIGCEEIRNTLKSITLELPIWGSRVDGFCLARRPYSPVPPGIGGWSNDDVSSNALFSSENVALLNGKAVYEVGNQPAAR